MQGFGLLDEEALGFEVFVLLVLDGFVVFSLGCEEVVACGAEAVEDEVVLLVAGVSYGLPFGLQCDDFLGFLFPLCEGCEFVEFDVLDLLAEGCFLFEVLSFACLDGFEVFLVS